jgi:hypothetical protein
VDLDGSINDAGIGVLACEGVFDLGDGLIGYLNEFLDVWGDGDTARDKLESMYLRTKSLDLIIVKRDGSL